jgi:hypothetical protein
MQNPLLSLSPDECEQVALDLIAAKDAFAERGWARGDYEDGKGHVCSVGAARVAVLGTPHVDELALFQGAASMARLNNVCNVMQYYASLDWPEHMSCASGGPLGLSVFNDCAKDQEQVVSWIDKALADVGRHG